MKNKVITIIAALALLTVRATAQPYYQGTGDGKYARQDVKKAIVRTIIMYEVVYGETVSAYSQYGSVIYWPLRNRVYDICVTEKQIGSPRALRELNAMDGTLFSRQLSEMQIKTEDDTMRLVITSDTSAHWGLTSKGRKSFVISGRERNAYREIMRWAFRQARLGRDYTGWDAWKMASTAGPGIYQSYILLRMRSEGLIDFDGDVNHKTATIQGLKGMVVSVTEAGMNWADDNIGFENLGSDRWDLWYRDRNTYEFTNSLLTLKAMEMAGIESFDYSSFSTAFNNLIGAISAPVEFFNTYRLLADTGYFDRIGPFESYGTNTYTYGDEIEVFIDWYDSN